MIYYNSALASQMIGARKNGILFSSDVSRACYDLNTIASPISPKTITWIGSLPSISNPFVSDTLFFLTPETLTIYPLDLAGVNKWGSFCPTLGFAFPFVTTYNPSITVNFDTMTPIPINGFNAVA